MIEHYTLEKQLQHTSSTNLGGMLPIDIEIELSVSLPNYELSNLL
jgi:hypothetical protein